MAVLDPLVPLVKVGLTASFILGIFVRPVAMLGILYVLGLWIGLYRHPGEWPWTYVFIAIVQVQFAVHDAGCSLGVDALRARPLRCEVPDLDSFTGTVTLTSTGRDGQLDLAKRAERRSGCGDWPNARTKTRRIRS